MSLRSAPGMVSRGSVGRAALVPQHLPTRLRRTRGASLGAARRANAALPSAVFDGAGAGRRCRTRPVWKSVASRTSRTALSSAQRPASSSLYLLRRSPEGRRRATSSWLKRPVLGKLGADS
jgi:hypothetical protein